MGTAPLKVEKNTLSTCDVLINRLEGKLAIENVNDFMQKMRQENAPSLILDMSGVSFLDSAGVGSLVSLFVSRRNQGKAFGVAPLSKQGSAVIQVSGLQNLLPIFDSVEKALAGS
jgi:anti-sigma B factor antagonist